MPSALEHSLEEDIIVKKREEFQSICKISFTLNIQGNSIVESGNTDKMAVKTYIYIIVNFLFLRIFQTILA